MVTAPTVNTLYLYSPLTTQHNTTQHRSMKFCFELVSCWGSSATSRSTDMTPTPSVDETRSLVTSLSRQRRIRRKRSLPPSSASAEWKPSLCSISEDKVVAERTVGSDRAVKRKSSGPTSSRVHVRYVSDDYGRASLPTAIPAFSPTPFLF